ncbi:MAG: tRNA (5-methylaminomethyl-2-thiouridine)(34)-methyltransferase MnmD [Daejeonella sp.]
MNHLSFAQTADGSKTIFNSLVGEHYHSRHGALQESRHVFLKSGLQFYLEQNNAEELNILEVGFGTGLNFLLSADYCTSNNIKLHYTGIEAFPLPGSMISGTGYDEFIDSTLWESFTQNYTACLNNSVPLNSLCDLEIAESKLMDFQTDKKFDVLYFDAFAAIHQPEMWNLESLSHITSFLNPGAVFVTYAITGNLKRTMKSLNFSIEKAPGAPGKREMLRAVKLF